MRQATLRSRLVLGFCLVTIPLVVVVLWNNLYATKVVHSQVAQSNQNLLTMYMNDMDKALKETENYLYKTAEQDQSVISLGQYPRDSWAYYLAKTQTVNGLFLNTNYYESADVLFAYSAPFEDLFVAPQQSVSYERKQAIQARIAGLLRSEPEGSPFYARWNVVELDGQYGLLRVVDTNYHSMVGAWVDLNRLMEPLHLLSRQGKGVALLQAADGTPISSTDASLLPRLAELGGASGTDQASASSAYHIVKLDRRYLLVSRESASAAMSLLLLLPEKSLLEGLPYFRVLTYWVPVVAAVMLIVYLIFLQRSIVRPIHRLIKGMRRVRSGDLSTRLEDDRLVEFATISETFNGMANQIEHLKIDIYEEQIRTQKAELKHLQAQIHPHFFMNSLNIVYHLAQIRSFEMIQNLALHLVRYFRYATRTQVSSLTLQDELNHIQDYLSIQKYRFPEAMAFSLELAPGLESFELPPLTVQPLVENAMVHGFAYLPGEAFRIAIRVYAPEEEPDTVIIEVSDNGKGFAEGKAEELSERAHSPEPGDGHVGLWNVVRRCRLYYKESVRMDFGPAEPRGANVTLRLPRHSTRREQP